MKFLLRTFLAFLSLMPLANAAAPELEVMSFNIRYANLKDGVNLWSLRAKFVAEVMLANKPDVIGVQEALRSQLDDLRPLLEGYAELGVGREDGKTNGEYSAILYKTAALEPITSGTFWLSDTPETPSLNWGSKLQRICTWARFKHRESGRTFFVFNSHWDHMSVEGRVRGSELLAKRIAAREPAEPVIVTGDFNCGETDRALAPLKTAGLRDTFRVINPETKDARTFHDWKGGAQGGKIDYILVNDAWTSSAAEIIRTSRDGKYPSDHYPVRARLKLEK